MRKAEGVSADGINPMTTGKVDGVGGTASSVRIWRDRVGLVAMLTDPCEFGVAEPVSDACENAGLTVNNLETRKRKTLPSGETDVTIKHDPNKRNRHEFTEYNVDSSNCNSDFVKPHATPSHCVVSSCPSQRGLERGTSAAALGATVLDTSNWSTDNYTAGDDEDSRGATSTFNSSEEGCSEQNLQCHDFFGLAKRDKSSSDKSRKQRDDLWTGGSNLLQIQLGSYIQKERQKLESEYEEGSCDLSEHVLSAYLRGYTNMEPVTGMHNGRSTRSSGLLSGISGASRSFAGSSQIRSYGAVLHSSDSSSMPLPSVRNKRVDNCDFLKNGEEGSKNLESIVASESEERLYSLDTRRELGRSSFSSYRLEKEAHKLRSKELQHTFVLSSGRQSQVEAVQDDAVAPTIDRDFDEYFAKLML